MKTAYEFIIVGCGGIGSATAYWLSRHAGAEVLGLEQFHLGHDNGASQDHSRIIRLAYHAPEYAALTPHTYTAWQTVEEESGIQLVHKTGGLNMAKRGATGVEDLEAYASSMSACDVDYERLTAPEVMYRWPQWHVPDDAYALFQRDTGLVDARKGNAVHIALARARGATILATTPVRAIRPEGDGFAVQTDDVTFTTKRVIITADAWTNTLLSSFGGQVPLIITQEQVTYFATPNLRDFAPDRFPVWIWHGRETFYGFPVYGEVAVKASEDLGGEEVTADTRTFAPNPRALQRLKDFLGQHLPGALGPELYTKTCLYTMPPDRNFVIDILPEHPGIAVALGAAHAFKFAGVIGQILCDLVISGDTSYPIDTFKIDRPALTDPAFRASLRL
jgi:sarcosine oxidase